jgi:cation:H+ antiporter
MKQPFLVLSTYLRLEGDEAERDHQKVFFCLKQRRWRTLAQLVFAAFGIAVIATVFTAIKLSTYANMLSERTALGGMVVGTLLLAGATSLPEVTTSLSAIGIGKPDLAIGNILGSNLFNLLILAVLDLHFRKQYSFESAEKEHRYTLGVGIVLTVIVLIALTGVSKTVVFGIGGETLLLLSIYAVFLIIASKSRSTDSVEQTLTNDDRQTLTHLTHPAQSEVDSLPDGVSVTDQAAVYQQLAATKDSSGPGSSVKHAAVGFAISAAAILLFGSLLTITADRIGLITGLSSSFIGIFLIAFTTSLPELISCYVAFRLQNINLAVGSILGSNLFNIFILCISDGFYRPGAILSGADPVQVLPAFTVLVLSGLVMYSLLRKKSSGPLSYIWPSVMLVAVYFISSYTIFQLS